MKKIQFSFLYVTKGPDRMMIKAIIREIFYYFCTKTHWSSLTKAILETTWKICFSAKFTKNFRQYIYFLWIY